MRVSRPGRDASDGRTGRQAVERGTGEGAPADEPTPGRDPDPRSPGEAWGFPTAPRRKGIAVDVWPSRLAHRSTARHWLCLRKRSKEKEGLCVDDDRQGGEWAGGLEQIGLALIEERVSETRPFTLGTRARGPRGATLPCVMKTSSPRVSGDVIVDRRATIPERHVAIGNEGIGASGREEEMIDVVAVAQLGAVEPGRRRGCEGGAKAKDRAVAAPAGTPRRSERLTAIRRDKPSSFTPAAGPSPA